MDVQYGIGKAVALFVGADATVEFVVGSGDDDKGAEGLVDGIVVDFDGGDGVEGLLVDVVVDFSDGDDEGVLEGLVVDGIVVGSGDCDVLEGRTMNGVVN